MAQTDEPGSVHLSDWPKADTVDTKIVDEMAFARGYIVEGLSQRAEAKIKVRQPLQSVAIKASKQLSEDLKIIIMDELNVKKVMLVNSGKNVELDTTMTESLKLEGLARDIIRQIQETRKKAGLDVSDRIFTQLITSDDLVNKAIKKHIKEINAETLTVDGNITKPIIENLVKIDGLDLSISIQKTSLT
jgi:isoleucyl-tRNA synthetase